MAAYPEPSTTIALARIIGLYFMVVGVALALNPNRFQGWYMRVQKDDTSMVLGAILAVFFGAFIVSTHNIWVLGWPVIITITGYWSLLKGAGLLIYPGFVDLFRGVLEQGEMFFRIAGVIYAALGMFLAYNGFC